MIRINLANWRNRVYEYDNALHIVTPCFTANSKKDRITWANITVQTDEYNPSYYKLNKTVKVAEEEN